MTSTAVFQNNGSQAVRLPAEARLPEHVKRVEVQVRGLERVIVPVGRGWNSFFTDSPAVSDDFMPERAALQVEDRAI